jgi:protein arginine kinase activator
LSDFRELGRLGCPRCYDTFEEPLRELLRRLHGSSRHVGKRYHPGVRGGEITPPGQEADLRERLRQAVEAENFELAAELRDRLRVSETPGADGRSG